MKILGWHERNADSVLLPSGTSDNSLARGFFGSAKLQVSTGILHTVNAGLTRHFGRSCR